MAPHPGSNHAAMAYGMMQPHAPAPLLGAHPVHQTGPYAHAPPHGLPVAGAHPGAGHAGPHTMPPSAFGGPMPPPPFL
jgi:hypothetical protein